MIFFSRSALTASPVRNLFFQKLCFVTIKMKYEAKPLQKWIPHRRSRECGAVFDSLRGAGEKNPKRGGGVKADLKCGDEFGKKRIIPAIV